MDSTRFDALTRSLATAANRRVFVRSAFAAVAAGVGGAFGHASAVAAECKRGGKRCKKHKQCCSGMCVPDPAAGAKSKDKDGTCCTPDPKRTTCRGLCGPQINNCGQRVKCGKCCTPDAREVTCAGVCGPQTNNCDVVVECGKCGDEICLDQNECASGECCEGACCGEDIPSTAACCNGACCDCFQNNAPGGGGQFFCCPSSREICGTYPNDSCCLPQDTCVDGHCVPIPQACPPEGHAGELNEVCPSGCCGTTGTNPGICCPADRPDCVQGACVAIGGCADQSVCPSGTLCTAYDGNDGVCCPSNRYYEIETGDPTVPLALACCFAGQEARGCDDLYCTPVSYLGCSATFRGSQPRIGR